MDKRDLHREGTENRVEGSKDELKGKVRHEVGDMTDDHSEQLKGKAQELKGKAQRKVGEMQSDAATDDDRNRNLDR